jgi:hypothetical protein
VVVADAGYGDNTTFRPELTDRGFAYVVAAKGSTSAYPHDAVPQALAYGGTGRPSTPRYRTPAASLRQLAIAHAGARCPSPRTRPRKRPWPRSGCRGQGPRPRCGEGVRGRLRREVPQGRREDHDDLDELLGFCDYPRRALGASAHDEPHMGRLSRR